MIPDPGTFGGGGWQPIATVPQDGTRVLVGRFSGLRGDKHDGFMQVDWWRTDRKNDGFLGLGKFNTRYWPATHWQPLPGAFGATPHSATEMQEVV